MFVMVHDAVIQYCLNAFNLLYLHYGLTQLPYSSSNVVAAAYYIVGPYHEGFVPSLSDIIFWCRGILVYNYLHSPHLTFSSPT